MAQNSLTLPFISQSHYSNGNNNCEFAFHSAILLIQWQRSLQICHPFHVSTISMVKESPILPFVLHFLQIRWQFPCFLRCTVPKIKNRWSFDANLVLFLYFSCFFYPLMLYSISLQSPLHAACHRQPALHAKAKIRSFRAFRRFPA